MPQYMMKSRKEVDEAGALIPVELLRSFRVYLQRVMKQDLYVMRKKAREALYRQGKFREVKLARQQKAKRKYV